MAYTTTVEQTSYVEPSFCDDCGNMIIGSIFFINQGTYCYSCHAKKFLPEVENICLGDFENRIQHLEENNVLLKENVVTITEILKQLESRITSLDSRMYTQENSIF